MSCPVGRRDHFVPLVGVEPTLLSELVSKTSACYQFRHKGINPCFHPLPDNSGNTWKGLKLLYPRRDSNSHVLTDTGFLDRGVYHSTTWALPFRIFKSAICHLLFVLPIGFEPIPVQGLSLLPLPIGLRERIKQKTRTFYGSGLYLIWNYLLHHEINPNFAQPEPAVLIHNVLFTTIVRFKFVIFRFIVLIISYILKSFCLFCYFIQI